MSDIERTFVPSETGQLSDNLIGTVLSPDDFVYVATTGGIEMRRKSDLELVKRITRFVGRDSHDYGAVADVVSLAVDHNYVWVSCLLDSVAVIVRLRWAGLTVKDVWTLPDHTTTAPQISLNRTRLIRAANQEAYLHSKLPPFRLETHATLNYGTPRMCLGQSVGYFYLAATILQVRPIPALVPILKSEVLGEEYAPSDIALDDNIIYTLWSVQGVGDDVSVLNARDRTNLNLLGAVEMDYVGGGGATLESAIDFCVDDGYVYVIGTNDTDVDNTLVKAEAYDPDAPGDFGTYADEIVLSEAAVAIACIPPMYYTEFINEGQGGEAVVRMQFPQPWSDRKTRLPVNPVARLALRVQATLLGAIVPLLKPVVTLALRVSASGYLFRPMAPVARLALRVLAEAEFATQQAEATLAMRVSAERVDDSA